MSIEWLCAELEVLERLVLAEEIDELAFLRQALALLFGYLFRGSGLS